MRRIGVIITAIYAENMIADAANKGHNHRRKCGE